MIDKLVFLKQKARCVISKPVLVLALAILNIAMLATWIHPLGVRHPISPEKIAHEIGFAYVTMLRLPFWWRLLLIRSDGPGANVVSNLRLFENGKEIGPPHSLHTDIRNAGGGRYSHWGITLYFAASDNSDPTTMKRVYEVRRQISPPGWFLVSGFALLLVTALGPQRTLRKVVLPLGLIALGVATFVLAFELLLRSDYAKLNLLGVYGKLPKHLLRTLNSKSYRDGEHRTGKVRDRIRILILGDSITVGDSLADDQIYPRLLGARLGSKVEIIAMARDGWSTADELDALKREGLSYSPDIVVVAAVTNDAQPISTEPSGLQPEWAIFTRLPLNLDFFRFLDYNINRLGDICGWRYSYLDWERDLFDPNKRYFRPWQATVRELADLLKDHGIPGYAFIMISTVRPSSPEQIRKYDILTSTFADAGFATVNLREDFVREFGESGGTHLWALPNDPHPGPAVDQFFAREMAKVLGPRVRSIAAERGLLPQWQPGNQGFSATIIALRTDKSSREYF